MAITLPTTLEQNSSISVATSQATAAFTMPTTGMVLACWGIRTSVTLSNPTLTDNIGGTWGNFTDGTNVANSVIVAGSARIKVFRCTAMVAGTATLTLDCGANSHLGWTWHILHYPDCLNQNAIQIVPGTGSGTALLSTLAAMQAANGTLGFGGNVSATGSMTVGAGFTGSGASQRASATGICTMAEAQTGNDTTVDMTGPTSVSWSMLAAEVAPNLGGGLGLGLASRRLGGARFRRPAALLGGA